MQLSPSMVVEVGSHSTASFGLRLVGRLLDVLLGVGLACLGLRLGLRLLNTPTTALHLPAAAALAWILSAALLHGSCAEALGGATPGKALLRLRVTSEDLTPCSLRGALVRNLALVVDGLGFTAWRAMARSLMSQRLGDQWGHTLVLNAHSVPPDSRRGAGRLALGLLSCGALWVLWGVLAGLLHAR